MIDIRDVMRLPCGCICGKHPETKTFVMVPCSQTCSYYAYAHEQARKLGKPVGALDLSETRIDDRAITESPLFNSACPYCGTHNNGYTSDDSAAYPKDGSIAVCGYCSGLAIYTPVGFRRPSTDERAVLEQDHTVKAITAAGKVIFGT